MEARDEARVDDVEILRIEQLYPFPSEPLVKRLSAMTDLEELVWCQEEPRNNGSWFFVEPFLEECLKAAGKNFGPPTPGGQRRPRPRPVLLSGTWPNKRH
jgi:2-oxoglutarate dehydrogenase E1 component